MASYIYQRKSERIYHANGNSTLSEYDTGKRSPQHNYMLLYDVISTGCYQDPSTFNHSLPMQALTYSILLQLQRNQPATFIPWLYSEMLRLNQQSFPRKMFVGKISVEHNTVGDLIVVMFGPIRTNVYKTNIARSVGGQLAQIVTRL